MDGAGLHEVEFPSLTVVSWWLCSLWWRCGDDVRGLYVPVWECTCSLGTGQRSLSEQLFIKGFRGNVLPNIAAGGQQNEVKPHLLEPCRAEYWLTGTFQVFGTTKVLMERHVKSLVLCFLRSETLLRWEHLGAFSAFESAGLLSISSVYRWCSSVMHTVFLDSCQTCEII